MPWQEYRYAWYARRFGWTPEQVEALPLSTADWLFPITGAIDAAEAKAQQQAQETAERRQRKFGRH